MPAPHRCFWRSLKAKDLQANNRKGREYAVVINVEINHFISSFLLINLSTVWKTVWKSENK